MDPTIITVNARSYDNAIRKSWTAELLERSDQLLVLKGLFAFDVEHSDIGLIRRGTISYEYFWPSRWYNVFRFHDPGGPFRCFYCNVTMPPVFDGSTLDYIDLDIDILLGRDGLVRILDEDEFRDNAAKYSYPAEVKANAAQAAADLTRMIRGREFPFDVR
ncbi:MAG: DUF402 domain-containing protein [Acidobacteria bacterium]|nr:DUF402 domain-containing protein [Acidobacteriota bacterium]